MGVSNVAGKRPRVLGRVASLIWLSWQGIVASGRSLVKSADVQSWLEQLHMKQREPQEPLCACDEMSGLDVHTLGCIQSVVSNLAAPYKKYMQELHTLPSRHVIDSLAAEPHTSEALVFFTEFKDAHVLVTPNITMSDFRALSPRVTEVVVSSSGIAAFVALETNTSGSFSENGFLLLPWEHRPVAFLAAEPLQSSSLESSLTFLSLLDTTLQM